jgi:glycerophosphoryl diester phosphodiesterase
LPSYFEIHGHRGAMARMPENTLPAFQYAIGLGVTALELDLGVTKDERVVVNHDFEVNTDQCIPRIPALVGVKKPLVHKLNLKEVQSYDCGSIQKKDFPLQLLVPGARIPSFREFLYFLKNNQLPHAQKVKINIETKIEEAFSNNTVDYKRFVDLVMAELLAANFPLERVIMQSFDYRTIKYVKTKWRIKTSALMDKSSEKKSDDEIVKEAQDILRTTKADYISPHGGITSKQMVESAHTMGKKVLVWTIDKKRDWRHFARMGVDGIISNDPGELMKDLIR